VAIARAAGSFLEAGIADVRVVVGWRGDEVAAAAADLGVAIVVNDGWERGMFSSVAVGVASLPADVEAFFLLPADCAVVRSETIGASLAWRRHSRSRRPWSIRRTAGAAVTRP